MDHMFTENWEQRLETQFWVDDRNRKRAYICSPLRAKTEEEFLQNMHMARAYMFYASTQMGMLARAPHAYLPLLLCDELPKERALALQFGLRILESSDLVLVCGNRLSEGMCGEIIRAASLHMTIVAFDETLYWKTRRLVMEHGGNRESVSIAREHVLMAQAEGNGYLEK